MKRIFVIIVLCLFCMLLTGLRGEAAVIGNDWQYLDSLHGITNTWLWPAGKDTFKADCNIDWHSSPEYRFVYLDADGNETLLRDYGEDPVLHTAYPGTGNLRVYARIKGEEQDPDTYFDYPADFDFARRMRTFEY